MRVHVVQCGAIAMAVTTIASGLRVRSGDTIYILIWRHLDLHKGKILNRLSLAGTRSIFVSAAMKSSEKMTYPLKDWLWKLKRQILPPSI